MKRNLKSIAMQLSENDIQELIRLKKTEDKRVVALRKQRKKLAADLAKLDNQIAKLGGDSGEASAPAPRERKSGKKKPGRKAGRKPAVREAKAASEGKGKRPTVRRGGKTRVNLTATVREIFAASGAPLKASQVVDALPEAGIKIDDVAAMRKRISVILASQKNSFEQVERGVYQLKAQ